MCICLLLFSKLIRQLFLSHIVAGRSAPQGLGPHGESPKGLAMEGSSVIKKKKTFLSYITNITFPIHSFMGKNLKQNVRQF